MSTLAEALLERADLHKQAASLRRRILRHARARKGEAPAEDPAVLLDELERVLEQHETVVNRINTANHHYLIEGAGTLSQALAKRDRLRAWLGALQGAADAAAGHDDSLVFEDPHPRPKVSHLSVQDLRQRHAALARDLRQLNAQIQASNWLCQVD